jgi:hypothetical protein
LPDNFHVGKQGRVYLENCGDAREDTLERLPLLVLVGRVSQATGRTATGLTVALPYLRQRYILYLSGTMFELQHAVTSGVRGRAESAKSFFSPRCGRGF